MNLIVSSLIEAVADGDERLDRASVLVGLPGEMMRDRSPGG